MIHFQPLARRSQHPLTQTEILRRATEAHTAGTPLAKVLQVSPTPEPGKTNGHKPVSAGTLLATLVDKAQVPPSKYQKNMVAAALKKCLADGMDPGKLLQCGLDMVGQGFSSPESLSFSIRSTKPKSSRPVRPRIADDEYLQAKWK